jgi:2-keto-4-pentenoate hydratase/2-oxohepta-3-ene-1,7-dioic acid hydratase in catechol pathway
MRLVSFSTGSGALRAGLWFEEGVLDIHEAEPRLPASVREILEGGRPCLEAVRALKPRRLLRHQSVRLGPPVPQPQKIVCVGLNYRDHCAEQNVPVPREPVIFAKFATALAGPRDAIVLPKLSSQVDPEVELAFVIGKAGRHIPEQRAIEHVAGYMVFNDVTARDLQRADKQWVRAKSFDTFAPCGPALVTADEVPDPQNLRLELSVNGELRQSSNTNQMIFSVAYLVSFLSRSFTWMAGDVVATGTPPGVGVFRKPPVFLKPGDRVACSIEGLGVLENPCVAEL